MVIENQLRELRKENELTQAELAEKVSVSRQTINAIETGKYDPSLELALKLAELFNTEVEKIFTVKEE